MIGATTELRPLDTFKPPIRLRYDYVSDSSGTPRDVARMTGDGPTWLGGYCSLPDRSDRNRLVATYTKIRPPLTAYEKGLCVWNNETEKFEKHSVVCTLTDESPKPPAVPHGHPVFWHNDAGERFVLFGDPFPALRCPATFEAWSNPKMWEQLKPQAPVPMQDAITRIKPHRGTIAWSDYRKKWVTVFTQQFGESSQLGELWYAEADAPTGPWGSAIKVVTHNKYSFYNPQLHPEFTDSKSPILLFEATYTHTLSPGLPQQRPVTITTRSCIDLIWTR